jgi:hypothetical protein
MEANKSQGVDNNLDKEKSTCLKNQNIITTQNIVANQNGMLETPNGYGVTMNSINKSYKSNYEFEIRNGVGTIDEKLSPIKGDGGKVLNQNERRSSCRCLQNNNKG